MTDSPDYNLDNISGSGWFVGAPKMDNFTFGSCLVENIQWSAGEGAQIAFLYPGTSSPAVYNTRIQPPVTDNIRINASAIRITTNTDASECYVYLTLYYTKTTD